MAPSDKYGGSAIAFDLTAHYATHRFYHLFRRTGGTSNYTSGDPPKRKVAFVVSFTIATLAIAWNLTLQAQPQPADAIVPLSLCQEKLCSELNPIQVDPICTCRFDPGGVKHPFCIQTQVGNCYVPNVDNRHTCTGVFIYNELAQCGVNIRIC